MTLAQFFCARVTLTDGCWGWRGRPDVAGYSRLSDNYAHRIAYEMFIGPIPEGLVIDHLCRNRACVNPAHMEAVTRGENIRRGVAPSAVASRTPTCPKCGDMKQRKNGEYRCPSCRKAYERNRQERRLRQRRLACQQSVST